MSRDNEKGITWSIVRGTITKISRNETGATLSKKCTILIPPVEQPVFTLESRVRSCSAVGKSGTRANGSQNRRSVSSYARSF